MGQSVRRGFGNSSQSIFSTENVVTSTFQVAMELVFASVVIDHDRKGARFILKVLQHTEYLTTPDAVYQYILTLATYFLCGA